MASDFDLQLFEQQLVEVRQLEDASRWQLERETEFPLGLLAVMYSAKDPSQLYKARFRWTDLFGPFSLKFIDIETGGDTNPRAWPRCTGFAPQSLFACIPLTVEGHFHHPEWVRSAATRFPATNVPLQFALLSVQHILDSSYEGRCTQ